MEDEAAHASDDSSDGASQAPSETPSVRAKKYREFVAQTPEDELLNYVDKPMQIFLCSGQAFLKQEFEQ